MLPRIRLNEVSSMRIAPCSANRAAKWLGGCIATPAGAKRLSQKYQALHRMKVVNIKEATHDGFSSEDQHCYVSGKYR